MDRDFPMSRRDVGILVVGLVILMAVGIALFGGLLPGIHPNLAIPDVVTVQGHQFYVEVSPLHVPFFANQTSPWNVTFRNVTFRLWLTNWYSATGGVVHGVGTEPNGTSAAFTLGAALPNGSRVSLYLAPDFGWGVWWTGGFAGGYSVQLLVKE
jgi:hypothetical protein